MTNSVYSTETKTTETARKLCRPRDGRIVAGVCAGWARYLGVDVTVVRILVVAATVISVGAAIPIYVAAWLLTPEEEAVAGETGQPS